MAGKVLVFIGGIRSGKSAAAEARFKKGLKGQAWKVAYLATLDPTRAPKDKELKERIALHRKRRPSSWLTLEVKGSLALPRGVQAVLMDGLGLWLALQLKRKPEAVLDEVAGFSKELGKRCKLAVLVLDEVGQGGVPANALQRRFCDLNGRANQLICAGADKAWRVDAGLAQRIK
jgi:adenosyl cobinamide kinase/adenosyl cobinamide phosphate guanylyltransferase